VAACAVRHDGRVHAPDVGQAFHGRYVLRERLGDGGTATVFRADDLRLDRPVAIKVYGPESAVSDTERRQREAHALAGLRHPAIVTLFDARLDATPPYLVLEFVDGETLARRIDRGPLSATETRLIGAAAASGLAAAHEAGIVHRDVKPANIIIPADPESAFPERADARLLDFGIAHALGGSRATSQGSVLGSATYVSPEQARGAEVTPASDVYSLGLVLIECLTGRPAFSGSTHEVLATRLVRSPALDDPALAADAELLGRMTALEPTDRPSALEVAHALGLPAATRVLPAASAALPTERITAAADAPSSPAPAPAFARRRGAIGLAVAALGALIAVAVVAVVLAGAPSILPALDPTPGRSESPADEVVLTPTPDDEAPGNSGNAPGKDKDDKDDGNGNKP
jgi:serine/threonine protein kinase